MITKFKIEGMHCASCKALIEDVCKDIEGVKSCDVDLDGKLATIEHDDGLDISLIKKEITGVGAYQAEVI